MAAISSSTGTSISLQHRPSISRSTPKSSSPTATSNSASPSPPSIITSSSPSSSSSPISATPPPRSSSLKQPLPAVAGAAAAAAAGDVPANTITEGREEGKQKGKGQDDTDQTAPPFVRRHSSSPSTASLSNGRSQQRTSAAIFSLAAAALDKTQSRFANFTSSSSSSPSPSSSSNNNNNNSSSSSSSSSISNSNDNAAAAAAAAAASEPSSFVRHRQALARLSLAPGSPNLPIPEQNEQTSSTSYRKQIFRSSSNQSLSPTGPLSPIVDGKIHAPPALPISKPYSETDPNTPPPIKVRPGDISGKMHQTSSRLLRMTDDDRPFTKDFNDLFATLIVSLLPLTPHRVRLTKVDYTFLSEDAINNLGSLKFSQSNRMPDPKDPSRIVTTTTTTTFSMAKDMARSICQRFLDARFIESADGKYQQVYNMKGSVWQLTPKGVSVLDTFCSRNGIQQKQVGELLSLMPTQLVTLEREPESDKVVGDRNTIEVIFRRFAGAEGRNMKANASQADSESLVDYRDGLTGVKMAAERRINGRTYRETLTGKAAADWLLDCCSIVDRRETIEIASLFVEYQLLEPIAQDRGFLSQNPGCAAFQPTKYAVYQLSPRAKEILSGGHRSRHSDSEGGHSAHRNAITRDSNTQRLDRILNDAALRLLFRENLRETHCEENLSFYRDVDEFVRQCKATTRLAQKTPSATSIDSIKEIMAQAYGIYNAFLAPGSPCELNIDHQLRSNLAMRMTKAVGQDVTMIETLQEVTSLFEDAQNAVFKLMASDSVPKFLRTPKYEHHLRNYELDSIGVPERSHSGSKRN